MITVQRKVEFQTARRSRKVQEENASVGRVPRVSRLMALAIRLDQMIRDGEVADQAELARLGHVTRARLTQIMNLLQLAPDIQEAILFLPVTERGRDIVTERDLRPIAAGSCWKQQRNAWVLLKVPCR
ncbi:hypothetical protein [Blastopirellula retiformator]|uniref:Uncharacterized protein n=1 Tax=Blastopirellula retiformator TaxID=2527970 RepID=A0A5C5UW78_9BACT|nr:hypothetical protein [Blastopirellula retiformator]TWT30129.1 hypothetical protein Enr8_47880 [Blastopirellula retiformator]